MGELESRIKSDVPLRPCDSPDSWERYCFRYTHRPIWLKYREMGCSVELTTGIVEIIRMRNRWSDEESSQRLQFLILNEGLSQSELRKWLSCFQD